MPLPRILSRAVPDRKPECRRLPVRARLEIEQVDGSDRFPRCVVDHQPQLSASVNTSLLLLDELFDRIVRERFDRTADCPQRRIVFPPAEQFEVLRFDGPQAANMASEHH